MNSTEVSKGPGPSKSYDIGRFDLNTAAKNYISTYKSNIGINMGVTHDDSTSRMTIVSSSKELKWTLLG